MSHALPTIILKLDDVTHEDAAAGRPVCDAWLRCVDALRTLGVPAALGVIGYSLERDRADYFDWIRALAADGTAEFWNHGYGRRTIGDCRGEFERPLAEQIDSLRRTQRLARKKLGLTFRAFGPHWSATTAATDEALAAVPELKIVFARPASPRGGQTVLRRRVELERPIFVPNATALLRDIDAGIGGHDYLTLQGHPPAWDATALGEFVRAVQGLLARGCRFMTPSAYVMEQAIENNPVHLWPAAVYQ